MAKIVRYNGDTESYYPCTEPTMLVKGRKYEVILAKDRNYQTDYILKGIEGHFNSMWFIEVEDTDCTMMGVAGEIPVIGQTLSVSQMVNIGGRIHFFSHETEPVRAFYNLGNNIYQVITAAEVLYAYIL